MQAIRLSKSAIESYLKCPRCFWLQRMHKVKQPEGIRSGLPRGMDRIFKQYFDQHRAEGTLPGELADLKPLQLYPDQAHLRKLRYWGSGFKVEINGITLTTGFDDLLQVVRNGQTFYNMADYKTKGKEPKEGETEAYYQVQADCYDLALNENKYPTDHLCFYLYYFPESVEGGAIVDQGPTRPTRMAWREKTVIITANPDRARTLMLEAGACLRGSMPRSSKNCEYCKYISVRAAATKTILAAEGRMPVAGDRG